MADNETVLEIPAEVHDTLEDATGNPFEDAPVGGAGDDEGIAPGESVAKGDLMGAIKNAPPWVWIGLALAAGTLIIGILAYRRQGGASLGTTQPSAPGTYALDPTTQQLFSTSLQNQQTQNGLLQQLIAKLQSVTSNPAKPPAKPNKPFIPERPIHPPAITVSHAYSPTQAPSTPSAPTWPWGPPKNHGPSIGTPVRQPSLPWKRPAVHTPGVGGHWAV